MSNYIDLSESAKGKAAENLAYFVEAAAADLRDEIVQQMDPGPPRTGREYRVPGTGIIDEVTGKIKRGTGTMYTASAPGEPPAIRTGEYANAWQTSPAVIEGDKVMAAATNDRKTENGQYLVGDLLEHGTNDILTYGTRMEPRPHIRPAMEIVAQRWGGDVRSTE